MAIDVLELSDDEREVLRALQLATDADPLAPWFEHDAIGVHQLGAREPAVIPAGRMTIRSLNHRRLLRFDRSKAPRWIFRTAPEASEFTT
jgi:hypothetical protein